MLHWYACGADGLSGGRSVGRSVGHVISKFSWMGSLPHFITRGAPLRALRARELAITLVRLMKSLTFGL